MDRSAIKKLSSVIWPKVIPIFDKLNRNAEVSELFRSVPKVFRSLYDFHDYIQNEFIGTEPIDYLEFGTAEGNTIRHWAIVRRSIVLRS
jgi:hypothetical protein